jgi:hypothetical protein
VNDEHVPTDQETALYDAMTAGDWDTVEQMRADAYALEQTPDPDTGRIPAQQFEVDYAYALDHYHDDNEIPQDEREANTAQKVQEHNDWADSQQQEGEAA